LEELEERIRQYEWRIKETETLEGLHAGSIFRVCIIDKEDTPIKLIYKVFADDRNNEIEIYNKLLFFIEPLTPIIKVWTTEPEAILMADLKDSLKIKFKKLSFSVKKDVLTKILYKLTELHSIPTSNFINSDLPIHTPSTEWYEWCVEQFEKLRLLNLVWYKTEWSESLRHSFQICSMKEYEIQGPKVLTHGDPHLDNIFMQKDGTLSFIDWEWAALGSPLRDSSILLQDLYDNELINFIKDKQYALLREIGFYQDEKAFKEDFNHLYIEHSYMMLAWEIEKFMQGYISELELKDVIEFKIAQIEKNSKELQSF